jgi:hypothetical protein
MHDINFDNNEFWEHLVVADWVRDLESSDSRLHKERVIEKALMASKLGSAGAQGFLFNCYLAYNPFYVYNVKQVIKSDQPSQPVAHVLGLVRGLANSRSNWTRCQRPH